MTYNFPGRSLAPLSVTQTPLTGQLQEAKRLHSANRFAEARLLYEAILKARPNNIDVLHLLGFLLHQQGEHEDAIRLMRQALKANRQNAIIQLNLANILKHVGQVDEALEIYKKALKINPRYTDAYVRYGDLLSELGRFEDALTQFDKALATDGNHLEALNNRGNTLRRLGRHQPALASYDRALAINPASDVAHYNRGVLLGDMERFEEALASYDAALRIRPVSVMALDGRGKVLRALRRPMEAIASYSRALAIETNYLPALCNRANALRDLGRPQEALADYARVLSLDPSFVFALSAMGDTLKDLGRFEEAQQSFEKAIALDPEGCAHYLNLAVVKKFKSGDPVIESMEGLASGSVVLTNDGRAALEYALGKAYADMGDHHQAFAHYLIGAKAKRSAINYDEAATMRLFDRIEAIFSADFMASRAGSGDPSIRPIFIVGMPRSGTTLIEQILASHPQVFGAGELTAVNQTVNRVENRLEASFPDVAERLDKADFRQLGSDYLDLIEILMPGATRVIDKMPSNFLFLGLIHLMFPNARIIHAIRNPIDTCVSCFSIFFSEQQPFSYDLGELGRYYRRYQRMMAHWQRVMPQGAILDVGYEDVVADSEAASRRILAYCALPWDPACLNFHLAQRPVRTASAVQVRQPIYNQAVGRWQAYKTYLAPLIAELDHGC